jgi:hypothetical protein
VDVGSGGAVGDDPAAEADAITAIAADRPEIGDDSVIISVDTITITVDVGGGGAIGDDP